nr:reverse transcriptase domain-containing protein [Tanacetum cinerariifolium]
MSEPAELIPSPSTSAMRNTGGRGNEQVVKNSDRLQEKLKEVRARLNFEGCPGRNSKFQEVSQHSESRTPNVRGEQRRGGTPGRSRSMSRSLERTRVFVRIRHEGPKSPRHRLIVKGRRNGGVFNRLGAKKRVCPHTQKAATRVSGQEERSQLPGSVTMKEHLHGEQSHSQRVRIVGRTLEVKIEKAKFKHRGRRHVSTMDHLNIFQAAAKVEWWAMPTWCHMFNFTLTGSARKKCIKDPVEIHDIKQREEESTKDFVQRFKNESMYVKRALECIRISGFMHRITNPELIKLLHDNILKLVDEMMRVTTTFLRGEVAASNHVLKKALSVWKQHEAGRKQNFKRKGDFRNQQRSENNNKFYEFHGEVRHNTDECMRMRRQTEELIKNEKLSQIKELKQGSENGEEEGTKGPIIPEAEIGGHFIHRIYVDGGSASEILYEHYFNRLRLEVNNQMVPATTSLISFSGEIIRPVGQILLPVKIGDAKHSTSIWMNFMVARSPSPYNGIIRRPGDKKRSQAPERNKAIQEEVAKLIDAGIMKEVHYHNWLSNPVIVKKHDDNWRMCVEFKDLNKACPKDGYPLPEIDWKVESFCGYPFKCFLDVYKGYHQIKMAKEDKENEAFITNQGILCYSKMPFGLKNTGATYQRLVNKAFQKQIGKNLEVYMDDLVIKSRTEQEIMRDIKETFRTLQEINMKMNPKKCTFGVEEGMFLGYKSSEKSLPFFKALKKCTKKSDFHWTTKAEDVFKQMKKLIEELPTLTAPMEKEELIVYLAAAKEAVSAVLMTERETKQMPVYFVSHAQQGPKINYTPLEKLVLALVHASKRLKRYFQAHTFIVITDQPIKPRTLVKGQILVDFIVERPKDNFLATTTEAEEELLEPWILFTDGSSYIDGSEAGLILTNPEGTKFTYALRFMFDATNNKAKYEALIAGLRITGKMGIKNL